MARDSRHRHDRSIASSAPPRELELRRQAEEALRGRERVPHGKTDERTQIHELEVHQVELELQNEALRAGQAELEAARDRYRELYERAPVGYMTIDALGTILEINERVVTLLGRPRAELLGTPLSRYVARDHVATLGAHLRAAVGSSSASACDLVFVRPDAERRSAQLETVAADPTDGAPPRLRMVLLDTTPQRLAEEARHEAERALCRREEELLHLQRLEILGHLSARLAHEYKNIFGAMRQSVAAAADEANGCRSGRCPTTPHFDRLRADVERASALALQVVSLGRKQRPNLTTVELDAVVARMELVVRSLLGGGSIAVEVNLGAPGRWVRAGQGWLEQALLNLAMNARDAMPAGGCLTIETHVLPDGLPATSGAHEDPEDDRPSGPAVAFSVTDTGAGMFPATVARLFEPFFTTKKGQAGSGLGLSTVRDLVERMHGEITVQSAPGRGSTFTVALPLVPAARSSARHAAVRLPAPPRRPLTVLVVDDEPLILRTVEHYLRVGGHRPLLAGTLDDAIARLGDLAGPLDLLLTDVGLPDTTPATLTEIVHERHPRAAVLLMSADAKPELVAEGRIDPAAETIEKPFTEQSLLQRIDEVVTAVAT